MWLLTLVVAFVAGSSTNTWTTSVAITSQNSSSRSYNEVECLDRVTILIDDLSTCECHAGSRNDTSSLLDVECFDGVPLIDTLPRDVQRLVIQGIDEYQVTSMFRDLENSSLNCLRELAIVNSTFAGSNITLPWLPMLQSLNVSRNDLINLGDVSMTNASDLKVLDLSVNQFRDVPPGAFRTLTSLVKLSLRSNAIGIVDEDAFIGLSQLEKLDISDNELTHLPDGTLTHLSSLQTLNLSGNQLTFLGARWFEALGRLRELDVSRNGLTKAASGALQPLPGLSVLRLAENPLMERDVSLLLGTGRRLETVDASRTGLLRVPAALTRSVRALRLAGNKLTCIRDGDFDGYPLLKILDLSDNQLSDVEEDSLGRLDVLDELDLSGNRLKLLPRSLPSSLTLLNLRGNIIQELTINDLQGINNIQSLIIDDNLIEKIEEGAFNQLPLLTRLDISRNPIKQLPANTFAGPLSLANLRMSGLTHLEWEHELRDDMAFPVPTPEHLVYLDVSHSPALAAQLLADNAALSACKSLLELNLANTNITNLRSDLVYLLPQLRTLGLSDNTWNCSSELLWLGEWIRQHEEIQPPASCNSTDEFVDTLLIDLPPPLTTSTSSTVGTTISVLSREFELVPKSSFHNSNITNTSVEKQPMEKIEKRIVDEIPRTEIQSEFVTAPAELDDDRVNGISTALHTEYVHVTNQIKLRKKTESIEDNKGLHIEGKVMRERDKLGSRKTNEPNKLVRSYMEHQRLREILDNRVDSERLAGNMPGRMEIHGSDTSNSDQEAAGSFNKIAWDSRILDSARETSNTVELADRMKNTPQNFILANAIANTIAQELNGRAADSDARISEVMPMGTHPGMLVLVGAIIGAAAVFTIVLSRRATIRRRDRYHRHENIEVHTLTPTTELW